MDDQVDDAFAVFQAAVGNPGWAGAGDFVVPLPDVGSNHQVDQARLIFQGYERNALGRPWSLPQASAAYSSSWARLTSSSACEAPSRKLKFVLQCSSA